MVNDLVYDVGMHNGDDTAYYLARGFRVIAIEADPTLVEAARARFADAVADGRLTLEHTAIGTERGTATFWICPSNRVWNSFDKNLAGRDGMEVKPIEVQVRPFADILARHGVPLYLKIDIEGFDRMCLEAIDPADRPRYVSWEISGFAEVALMREKGYDAFQCISQSTLQPLRVGRARGTQNMPMVYHARMALLKAVAAVPAVRPLARAVKRALKGGPRSPAISGVASAPPLIRHIEWPGGKWSFPYGSSGPFGPDMTGPWRSAEEVVYEFLDQLIPTERDGAPKRDWFDVHATTLGPAGSSQPARSWAAGGVAAGS